MDRINTHLTEMLDIKYPIIGAPMFVVSYEELAIAVSEAGGLGCIPLPNYRTTEDLSKALKTIRAATDKPIGVDIHVSGKFPWEEQLALCLEAGVSVFITSLGDPTVILEDVHSAGGKVFANVISLEQGLKAQERGLDGLIAVASWAGGHEGTTPTIILVPDLAKNTKLPVIAAGGISTGSQMAAALSIGACGIVVGTRLVATTESRAAKAYKEMIIESGPEDIVSTDRITGNPSTWIAKTIEGIESGPEIGSRKWLDLWSAGKSVAQAREIKPARDLVREIVEDYFKACEKLEATINQ